MLRRTLLAATAVGAMMTGLPRAVEAVTYTLANQAFSFTFPAVGNDIRTSFGASFNIADAAVESGAFSVRSLFSGGSNGSNPSYIGDVSSFLGARIGVDMISSTRLIGSLNLSLTFATDRSITSGILEYRGELNDASLTFGPGTFAGSFGGEYSSPGCSTIASGPTCRISGTVLTAVPEPMSIALLGVGLLGTIALARRQF